MLSVAGARATCMNLDKIIADLYRDKRRVESAIEVFTQLQASPPPIERIKLKKKRGRKGMTPAERQEVSERMRSYWSQRRAQRSATV
jgi:hypothetical protein